MIEVVGPNDKNGLVTLTEYQCTSHQTEYTSGTYQKSGTLFFLCVRELIHRVKDLNTRVFVEIECPIIWSTNETTLVNQKATKVGCATHTVANAACTDAFLIFTASTGFRSFTASSNGRRASFWYGNIRKVPLSTRIQTPVDSVSVEGLNQPSGCVERKTWWRIASYAS